MTPSEINYDMVFGPDIMEADHPYEESMDWLNQWVDTKKIIADGRPYFLIETVGGEQPVAIWSCKENSVYSEAHLEWKEEE